MKILNKASELFAGLQTALRSTSSNETRPVARIVYSAALALSMGMLAAPSDAAGIRNGAYLIPQMVADAPEGFNGLCQRYSWACASKGNQPAFNNQSMQLVRRVNSQINRRYRQIEDGRQYNQEEVWALPTRRGGDCEDFALVKKLELIEAGIAPNRLLLATALDRRNNSHAVLIVRTNQGDYVLDNQRRSVLHWRDTGYTFLKLQNPNRPYQWDAVLAGGIFNS